MKLKLKDFNWEAVLMILAGWIVAIALIVFLLNLGGCAKHQMTVELDDGKKVEVEVSYLLQNKSFKSLTFIPSTGELTVNNFGSETDYLVELLIELIKADILLRTPTP